MSVAAERKLRVFVVSDRALRACTLSRVAASDGSAVRVQSVPLQYSPTGNGYGGRPSAWMTTKPITPGTYRISLEGDGRILNLVVDAVAPE